MSEDKKSLINLIPDSIDNAVKNITDKPTQNIGTTLADIWYLVFGGISQAAEKRKLEYAHALQEFKNELEEKIYKIPEDKLVEPDIQIVAQALEAAKYCIEKNSLRRMFSNLIAKSMNKETSLYSHPSFVNIIKQLSTYDARILAYIYECQIESNINIIIDDNDLLFPLSSLEKQGLIHVHMQQSAQTLSIDKNLLKLHTNFDVNIPIKTAYITLTKLGDTFCDICLNSEI